MSNFMLHALSMAALAQSLVNYDLPGGNCEFYPAKHPFKTYGAQQRDAKRRKKAKNHKK